MARTFKTVVVWPNGKEETFVTASSTELTAHQLANHWVKLNKFPGAKSVTVHETDNLAPKSLVELAKSKSLRKGISSSRPLTTPSPTVGEPDLHASAVKETPVAAQGSSSQAAPQSGSAKGS